MEPNKIRTCCILMRYKLSKFGWYYVNDLPLLQAWGEIHQEFEILVFVYSKISLL